MSQFVKISIITVVKNNLQNIERTISSILTQNCTDYEFIIIDGQSTDGTQQIIEKYRADLKFYLSEPDQGIYQAMNKGITRATGEYLLFLNSGDCLVDKAVLKRVLPELIAEHDVVYGKIKDRTQWQQSVTISDMLFRQKTIPHQAAFIKRSLFAEIGTYDQSYRVAGDQEFFLRAICKARAALRFIDLDIASYHMGGISDLRQDISRREFKQAVLRNVNLFYGLCFLFQQLYLEYAKLIEKNNFTKLLKLFNPIWVFNKLFKRPKKL